MEALGDFLSASIQPTRPSAFVVGETNDWFWLPPRSGCIEVNFDAAWDYSSHKAGLGVVARCGMAVPTRSSSVLMAEAFHAFALAKLMKFDRVSFETDSKVLCDGIKEAVGRRLGRSRMPSPISNGTGSPAKGIELPTPQHR
ncbi:hypothetical protein ACE6H2_006143 [Prunus campanulata]